MSKMKRALRITSAVITYIFLFMCVLAIFVVIGSRGEGDGAVSVFGYQMRVVISESMEKCTDTDVSAFEIKDIPIKSMVFIEEVPKDKAEADRWYSSLKVGDVLTFKYVYQKQETITHRITDVKEGESGGYVITLEGDNKASDSKTLRQKIDTEDGEGLNYVIGKVVAQSYPLGVVTWGVRQPLGMLLMIILPCLVIMIMEIVRIVNVLGADKKLRAKKEKEKQEEKIEALERMILELKMREGAEHKGTETSENLNAERDLENASSVQLSDSTQTEQ